MAKQVVTETRINDSVKVELSYEFEPALKGKKEYEEVVVGNVTKYWVRVADNVTPVFQTWKDKQKVIDDRRQIKAEKKKDAWNKLQEEKKERIKRYSEMAKLGELFTSGLQPTQTERESAVKLQKMSLRAQNKQLCKLV